VHRLGQLIAQPTRFPCGLHTLSSSGRTRKIEGNNLSSYSQHQYGVLFPFCMSSTSSMFHHLPLEIQYMIYTLVFIHVDAIETCQDRQTSLQNDILPLPSRVSISRRELSLLAINRHVRSVTLPFFWGENTFCFDASSYSHIRVCTIHTKTYTTTFRNPFHPQRLFVAVLLEWLTTTKMTASDALSSVPKTQHSSTHSADYDRSIIRDAQPRRVGRGLVRKAGSAEQDQRACRG
jgi:hypothetical protein